MTANKRETDNQKTMRSGRRADAIFRQLLSEAGDLCRQAEALHLERAETIALQRYYGQITPITRISFAFRGDMSRKIRDWLRRAELAVRTAATDSDVTSGTSGVVLINRLRGLIDAANVAVIRRSKSPATWAVFHAMVYHDE
jgi:hypothetical protein